MSSTKVDVKVDQIELSTSGGEQLPESNEDVKRKLKLAGKTMIVPVLY